MGNKLSPSASYSGGQRALDGLTVYAVSEHGETDVLVRSCMPFSGALLSIARELDARPERWRITVISSPSTILGDLRGRRHAHGWSDKTQMVPPEKQLLGRISRLDLLEL